MGVDSGHARRLGAGGGLGPRLGPRGDYAARCARLYAQGALEAAQATCELGLVVAPQDREVLRLLVRIHLDKGRWPRPRPTWTAWARTRRPPTSGPGPSSPRGGTGRFWPWASRGRRGGFSAPSPWSASGASRRRWPWPGAFPWTGRCGSFWGGFTWSWAGPWRGWPTWGTPRRKWSSRGGSSWPGGGLPRRPPSWRRSAPGFPRKAPSTGRPSPPWSSPASGGWTGRGVFRSGGARPGGEPPRPGACPPLALAPLRGGLPRASRLRGKPH